MEPLDLRTAAPRGPRTQIAGIVFTARVIDKLRASLPDGDENEYFPLIGFSEVWAYYTGIDLRAEHVILFDLFEADDARSYSRSRTP